MGDSDDGGDDEPRRGAGAPAQLQRYEHQDNDTAAQSNLLAPCFLVGLAIKAGGSALEGSPPLY